MNVPENKFKKTTLSLSVAILVVYLLLAVSLSQILHFSRALDEGYHLDLVMFLKENDRLPINYEERAALARADLPPLYHIIVALISPNIESSANRPEFRLYDDSPRYQTIDHQLEHPWTIDTEDLTWPYYGQFLVWQLGRGLSIIFGISTLVIVYFTFREIPITDHWVTALFGVAFLAFIPRYLILSGALNDDTLLAFLSALYFWMLVRAIKFPTRWGPIIILGLSLGLSLTVKYTLALMPFEILIVFGIVANQYKLGWLWLIKRLSVIGIVTFLVSSWWFVWNIWYFNTIAEDGLLVGILRSLFSGGYNATLITIGDAFVGSELNAVSPSLPQSEATLSQWASSTFFSFWGVSINGYQPGWPWAYLFIGAILLLACWGNWYLWRSNKQSQGWLLLAGFHTLLLLIIPVFRFETSGRLGQTAQGRHILIPAAAAIIGLIIWGISTLLPPKWHKPLFSLIILGLISWSGVHLYQLVVNAPPLLPVRTVEQAAQWLPNPIQAKFGEEVELVTYEIIPQPKQGVLQVELAWRSLGEINENYQLQLILRDSTGSIVSHWQGYHGYGRIPTLAWNPGDVVFDRLNLPLYNASPGTYQLQLQLLNRGGALPVTTTEVGQIIDTSILGLPQVTVNNPISIDLPYTIESTVDNPVDFALLQPDGLLSQVSQPEYRYPGTISIIASVDDLTVALIDSKGQSYPAISSQGHLHTFIIGPDWTSGPYHLEFSAAQGETERVEEVSLVVENWWERTFIPPAIERPVEANFANQFKFLGYDLPSPSVKAGEAFPVTLYWQAFPTLAPQANFTQFNNLHDNQGALWGGYDRLPLEDYSTLLWVPNEVVVDGYTISVAPDAPPGEYYLDVGYYIQIGESAVNLPLVVDEAMSDVSSVTIGPIEVVSP
ncbi:MAG: glycosyltransferase family 39 protein [Chloroflexota bacterium]